MRYRATFLMVLVAVISVFPRTAVAEEFVKWESHAIEVITQGPMGDRTRCEWLVWMTRDLLNQVGASEGAVACENNGLKDYKVKATFGAPVRCPSADPGAQAAAWYPLTLSWDDGGTTRGKITRAIAETFTTRQLLVQAGDGDAGKVVLSGDFLYPQ